MNKKVTINRAKIKGKSSRVGEKERGEMFRGKGEEEVWSVEWKNERVIGKKKCPGTKKEGIGTKHAYVVSKGIKALRNGRF